MLRKGQACHETPVFFMKSQVHTVIQQSLHNLPFRSRFSKIHKPVGLFLVSRRFIQVPKKTNYNLTVNFLFILTSKQEVYHKIINNIKFQFTTILKLLIQLTTLHSGLEPSVPHPHNQRTYDLIDKRNVMAHSSVLPYPKALVSSHHNTGPTLENYRRDHFHSSDLRSTRLNDSGVTPLSLIQTCAGWRQLRQRFFPFFWIVDPPPHQISFIKLSVIPTYMIASFVAITENH